MTAISTASSMEEAVPPLSLAEKYSHVVKALEDVEKTLRIKQHPTLIERAAPLEVDDLRHLDEQQKNNNQDQEQNDSNHLPKKRQKQLYGKSKIAAISEDRTTASLRKRSLKEVFTIDHSILPTVSLATNLHPFSFDILISLDVSHNELTDLPGLSKLKNLRVLALNRNWFNTLPSEIGVLNHLETLLAARNFLKPNDQSLRLETLKTSCPNLSILDLRYNQKCCRPLHRDRVQDALLPLKPTIIMTLWEEDVHGNSTSKNENKINKNCNNYVGSSAAQRNPILLRSQLEPLGTVALRKRLVCDFGKEPTDPAKVDRAVVMRNLLKAYYDEGLAYFQESKLNSCNGDDKSNATENSIFDYDTLVGNRKALQLYGSPVPEEKLQTLRIELKKWTAHTGLVNKNRERPSIHASNYMILRKPIPISDASISGSGDGGSIKPLSRRALRKIQKRERYRSLWEAGIDALTCIDPAFAEHNCTEIAITHGFSGSPHRDKQNCGPFYGLSLGNYDDSDGKGGIVVESSARVLVRVNTKGRLGRVDGRYVHWVAPWGNPSGGEEEKRHQQRYSLIYYETGHDFVTPGPAVFSIPEQVTAGE